MVALLSLLSLLPSFVKTKPRLVGDDGVIRLVDVDIGWDAAVPAAANAETKKRNTAATDGILRNGAILVVLVFIYRRMPSLRRSKYM